MVKSPPASARDVAQSLVREGPTCGGASEPVSQLLACALEPVHCNKRNHHQSSPHSLQLKKAQVQQ